MHLMAPMVLLIKSRVSTLAISGLTPDAASTLQQNSGDAADPNAELGG